MVATADLGISIESSSLVRKRTLEISCIELFRDDLIRSSGGEVDIEHAQIFWRSQGYESRFAHLYAPTKTAEQLFKEIRGYA